MAEKPTVEEIRRRIRRHIDHYGGHLPEPLVDAWDGYLAALIEWGLVSVSDHKQLVDLLPPRDDSPATTILLGPPDRT